MPHLTLLGDSVFDNAAYTEGGPSVVQQVAAALPAGWSASLRAVDGSTTDDIDAQLARLPADTSHLVLSVGGNNALLRADVLQAPVTSSAEALLMLGEAAVDFGAGYRRMLSKVLDTGLPLVVCTTYHGNFPEPAYRRCVAVALCAFNDVILRVAAEHRLKVIDLRGICVEPTDYANPIEPSSVGGQKIAVAIVQAMVGEAPAQAVGIEELQQTVQRMEARLSQDTLPAVQDLLRHYQALQERFASDLQASPRDVALARASALMLVQAVAGDTSTPSAAR